MIDVQAREISEKDLEAGLRLAHPEVSHETCNLFAKSLSLWNPYKMLGVIIQAVKYLEPQIRLAAKVGKHKKEYKLSLMSDRTMEKVRKLAAAPIEAVFTDPTYGKVHAKMVFCDRYFFCLNFFFQLLLCGAFLSSLNGERL